mmetsp:Transcript_2855/g.8352  ORF Transcript_2855/g.8352 Transcript_2855/m.8352 type:complete len:152 (-) Transcript_2855:941-1396(-)
MAGKALAAIGNMFSKLKWMSPFKITGVASDPEFKHYLDKAPDYRAVSPASTPGRAFVPQVEDKNVYDIKYYPRDTRREHMLVGGTGKYELVSKEVSLDPKDWYKFPEPWPAGRAGNGPYKWSKPIPYLDNENNGYTYTQTEDMQRNREQEA